MTPKEVLNMAKENGAKMVDLRFMDFPGLWQHFSVPIRELEESSFEDGFGFDGSSIRGWQPIHASDMLVIPDAATAKMDPFYEAPTLVLICDIADPVTREPYTRDPRNIAKKADAYLKSSGLGDVAYIGPEAEFFIFDDIRFESTRFGAFYEIDSIEGAWNTGRDEGPNLGYKPRHKEGYFPVPPMDKFQDLRTEMVLTLEELGIETEAQHHEVATAGQSEIDMRFKPLLQMADQLMWFKYVLKNVAYRNNHTVTFMPKPLFEDNGTGMHTHISIWNGDQPLFAGDKYAGVSQEALYAIGGILKHARALCAFTNPTTNSYKRLVPGFEAPVNLAYSSRNRSAAVRLPMYSTSPKAKRIEFRTPDPSCNGYLAFSAILMAVIDGIQNKIDPGDPLDKDIYNLPPEELAEIPSAPGSLDEALEALKADQEFLLKGDVFTQDAIDMWIEYKTENEINDVKLRPHPHEFYLYYDI
ncbi:MAG: type I glutamate--ammonia ligase [Deltaproteobacteria bacterium]|jgi:glutamine synthetase|nr:type I glutamate--ammonia ligase [Deltaproteobacteria bacterium]MBW2585012.1 type I glutamate--ammonia ligase [Deltaproteobacteria bacterium]